MSTGVELIAAERERQQAEEGYSPDHDREHTENELARAAAVYAVPENLRGLNDAIRLWPEDWYFKPTPRDRVRELVKAGALIAAELDRIEGES